MGRGDHRTRLGDVMQDTDGDHQVKGAKRVNMLPGDVMAGDAPRGSREAASQHLDRLGWLDGRDLCGTSTEQHFDDAPGTAADIGDLGAAHIRGIHERRDDVFEQLTGAVVARIVREARPLREARSLQSDADFLRRP